jgi:hypothetical protein
MPKLDKKSSRLAYTIRHMERALHGVQGAKGDADGAFVTMRAAGFDFGIDADVYLTLLEQAEQMLIQAIRRGTEKWVALGNEPWDAE